MYKITGKQVSFRVDEAEREQLNQFASSWGNK